MNKVDECVKEEHKKALLFFVMSESERMVDKCRKRSIIVFRKEVGGMSRQQVAFLEECRKIKGCGSLEEDFYTRFKPEVNDGAGAWLKKYVNVIKA